MLEKLQERIVEITKSIENIVAQHNYFTGALQEANKAVEFYIAHQEQINKIALEATSSPLEAVVDSVELINVAN